MKKLLYTVLLLLIVVVVKGQNSYTITSIPFNPDPFSSGTSANVAYDDMYGSVVPLPFSFCFYDAPYNFIVIGSNGIVTFDTTVANSYCPWPINTPVPNVDMTNKSIMAPIQDLNPALGGTIKYDLQGVAPYRRFIISYFEVPMFSCTTMLFSEQIILYETSNIIETHIMNKPLCSTWNGGAAVQGIQIDPLIGFVVPGRNHPSQWTAINDGFRFQPVGNCAGPVPSDSVSGKVFVDYNNNCLQDPNEFPIQNRAVLANNGQFYGWSNGTGHYAIGMVPGNYTISEYVTGPYFASNCVPGGAYNVTVSGNTYNNADFADSVAVICSDIMVDVGTGPMRRCGTSYAGITYCNNGNYPDSNVVINLFLNDSLTIDTTSMPYTTTGINAYQFAIGTLMPGQCGNIQLVLNVGCDSAGTEYCLSAQIVGTYATDCDPMNNSGSECQVLVAACDPNEKRVAAQNGHGYVFQDDIDANDELTYQISFQNLGTSYAEDVVIRDTLDDTRLRLETFQAGAGSAPYNYVLIGNVVIFRFENIMLPAASVNEPGSHGFVKFSIQQEQGHLPGTVIQNDAAIYFDFEAPVFTNQTVNTIPLNSAVTIGMQDVAQIYPNPGKDQLIVQRMIDQEMEFVLYDLAGKEVRRATLNSMRTSVNTADLNAGVYLYRLQSNGQLLEAGKWMKQ
ncbi:MAG: T9SS type A sorting domain-containing protein [Bacteroidetes bacterium]|nr:T9SS type A sorting domain-containing protein [Bacteroidota bacterium]